MSAPELREVRLIGFPLALHARASEHHAELLREFQLLALDPARGQDVPGRLVELVGELTGDYGRFTDAPEAARDAAAARGDETVDLVFAVPAEAGPACARLEALLDEADAFCRAGDRLLTLAAPPETVALRRWYLGEFRAQLAGAAPTPWPGS